MPLLVKEGESVRDANSPLVHLPAFPRGFSCADNACPDRKGAAIPAEGVVPANLLL